MNTIDFTASAKDKHDKSRSWGWPSGCKGGDRETICESSFFEAPDRAGAFFWILDFTQNQITKSLRDAFEFRLR